MIHLAADYLLEYNTLTLIIERPIRLTANKELAKFASINMNEPPYPIRQFLHCYTQLPPKGRDRKYQTYQEVLHYVL
jgi:hypothetical protein